MPSGVRPFLSEQSQEGILHIRVADRPFVVFNLRRRRIQSRGRCPELTACR
ncbi:MAG TPA: hypothetical protein PK175_02440 [Syntrophales bacterium]|nr:hypothetical protein [Syntrophales bacterium]HOU77741.1 hypothetical protein [Syntrophales bacterium]HQG33716.1 hypothetical protein [Syntrophales bacterium]HRU88247.1 hypothetical protein [Syntrophales bacterium]